MRTKLIRKKVINLTLDEYNKCYSLNLRAFGAMRTVLQYTFYPCQQELHRNGDENNVVYMIFGEDNTLLSWALVYWTNIASPGAYFYTRVSCRRLGYGSRLYNKIKKDFPTVHVTRHDTRSKLFFDAIGA
jgi:hypothetical protein